MEPWDELDKIALSEDRVALATLVATRGTSPRKEGARMWVGRDGAILGSVTIGGCVDAAVVRAAEDVLRESSPTILSVDLGDEDAHALGLTCAGAVDVLVRPVQLDRADPLVAAWQQARDGVASGRRVVVVMPVPGEADADSEWPSRLLVVFDDGKTSGTLGQDALDANAVDRAMDRLRRGGSRLVRLTEAGDAAAFFEVFGRGPLLVIVGGGSIAEQLSVLARTIGMHIVVVEGRERFADASRYPSAHEVRTADMPSEIVGSMDYDASSAIVVVAHDYKYDIPVLARAVRTGAGYVGMLGSRRRADTILGMLAERGLEPDELHRIRTPIGLDIGGQTAGEIALSILAEVVAVRNGKAGGSLSQGRRAPPGSTSG